MINALTNIAVRHRWSAFTLNAQHLRLASTGGLQRIREHREDERGAPSK